MIKSEMMDEGISAKSRVQSSHGDSHVSLLSTFSRPKTMGGATTEADEGQKARKRKVILMERGASGRGKKGSASRSTRLGHLDTWTLGLT